MKKNIFFWIAWVLLFAIMGNTKTKQDTILGEKKIVIIIPSYNNADCYQKNLDSVFNQKYNNWRGIYIDDVSSDGTGYLVEKYIKIHGFEHKFTVVRNKKRSLAMANLYRAIWSCDDNEIVATLDGDDWFAHNHVLSLLNTLYQDPNVWLTYGSYTDWPEPELHVLQHWQENLGGTLGNRPVPEEIIRNNEFRSFIGCTGQLRTFYAWLFKQIKLEDLMYQSDFLHMTYDIGIMIPMHEMAAGRFEYVSDIIYIHNLDTPLNDHKVDAKLQGDLEILLRNKPKYQPLKESQAEKFDHFKKAKADLIIFSYDRPLQLYALLESVKKYITGINSIKIINKASNKDFAHAYEIVQQNFPEADFIVERGKLKPTNFKTLTMKTIKRSTADHVIFAVDDIIVKDYVDLNECIQWLEKTHAYGFYLKMGTHLSYCYTENKTQPVPTHTQINNDILAWQFDFGTCDWNYPNTVDMTLYRKKDIISLFESLSFTNPNWLEGRWSQHKPACNVGLFYQYSKIVNIPINKVTTFENAHMNLYSKEQLCEKFEQGLKIDIKPLYQVLNNDVHMEYVPTFITRS